MLSRNLLLVFVITGLVIGSYQNAIYASDQEKWFDRRVSILRMFILLRDAEIQSDIQITLEQRKVLEELEQQHRPKVMMAMNVKPDEASKTKEEQSAIQDARRKEVSAIDEEFRLQIWKTLATEQRERVNQILFQLDVARALTEAAKVTELIQLDAEQLAALQDVKDEYKREQKENGKQLSPREPYLERSHASQAKRDEYALKILTENQRTEWAKLIGAPVDTVALRPRIEVGQRRPKVKTPRP